MHDVAAGGATALETLLTLPEVTAEYERHNLRVLQATSTPAYNLLCNTPVNSLETARGKRVRAIGAVWADTAEALGMTPVSIPWNEAYEGLQRGVFDCMVINPNQYVDGLVLRDVAPEYVPVTFAQLQASVWVMNLDTWNSFPPELQDFITQANVRAAQDIWRGYLAIEARAGELIAAGGVRTNDVSELEPIAAAQRAAAVAALAASAPPAVTDPQGVIDAYLARVAYWTQALVDEGYPVVERTPEAIVQAFAGLGDVDLTGFAARFDAEVLPRLLAR